MTALAPMGEGLQTWAARRGARLADEYVRERAAAGEVLASEFFNGTCKRERLLETLRDVAEPAFNARLADLEAGR